jgi:hypothetical protein
MTIKKYIIDYIEYNNIITEFTDILKNKLDNSIKYVYGPPRGGLSIAAHISYHLNLEYIDNLKIYDNILIVDDIVDSGTTFKKIYQKYSYSNKFTFASLFLKPRSIFTPNYYINLIDNNIWVQFPWEADTTEIDKEYMYDR